MFLEGLITKQQSLAGHFLSRSSSFAEVLVLAQHRSKLTFIHVHLEFQP